MSYGLVKGARQSLRRKKGSKSKLSIRDDGELGLQLPVSSRSDADWEFNRDDLEGLTEIGHGQFGVVYIGYAINIVPGESRTRVAVKTLADTSQAAKSEFAAEAKIMKAIDNSNIIRLLGVCTDQDPQYMIMEFMGKGDLKGFLKDNRPTRAKPSSISQKKLAEMGAGVANGMGYLAKMHIVHRDLAARNCLVSDTMDVKVGDFGLTRKTYSREYYRMTGSAPLPIRWMPPESFQDGVFSTASDIWAFGILLWEIQSFGKLPYAAYDNGQVAEQVAEDDYRLPAPGGCPSAIYDVMMTCWEEDAPDRGSFDKHKNTLEDLIPSLDESPFPFERLQNHGQTDEDPSLAEYEELDDAPEDGYDHRDAFTNYDDSARAPHLYGEIADADSSGYEVPVDFVAKRAVELASPVAEWISKVTKKVVDPNNLHSSLKSGEILCVLINKLKPGSVRKIHSAKHALKQKENLSHFLEGAKAFGLPLQDCFMVDDLFEDDDMCRVVLGLNALKKLSEN